MPAEESVDQTNVVVIGAGPVGLACAIELKRVGVAAIVLEKGALVNSLVGYPTNMQFFSTPSLLEIGGHPFPTVRYKPIREDGIDYYRGVAVAEELDIRLGQRVRRVAGSEGMLTVETEQASFEARHVIVATGFFDEPVLLNVPGEELPHVTHYYKEPFEYALRDVVVIGAKNSAAKAALECYRYGARVTMLIRGDAVSDSVKYWIKPDLENRIAAGEITAFFNAATTSIDERFVHFDSVAETSDEPSLAAAGTTSSHSVPADVVLALTGYKPDYVFLEELGITFDDDVDRTPVLSDDFETSRRGIFMAGTVCGGLNTSRWFIENGRHHAALIAAVISERI
ncbi:MAG: YpdA family putative bacillithiol disulfide reductase [Rhodothermales bacterium]|nr:YpdA family putative bacillithiol disulfide reductase [Rhodothermales bacterium]